MFQLNNDFNRNYKFTKTRKKRVFINLELQIQYILLQQLLIIAFFKTFMHAKCLYNFFLYNPSVLFSDGLKSQLVLTCTPKFLNQSYC